jgi:hypothetical protein
VVHLTQYDRDPLTGLQDMDRFTFAGDNAADRANQTLTGDNYRDTLTNSSAGGVLVGAVMMTCWWAVQGSTPSDTPRRATASVAIRTSSRISMPRRTGLTCQRWDTQV